ncbi:MAG: carboxypeptidase-like regulatory domain-containing protein [Nannocystaceae bacterium]|nr:carboxypeptidase-like regulatory domain-containing protein [bacterium]
MMNQTLKLLGLGVCVAIATGCPADDSDPVAGTESSDPTGDPTTDTETTADPTGDPTGDTETTADPTSDTEDPDTDTTDPDTTDTDDPTAGGECLGVPESGAAEGEACTANDECESGVCLLFQDVPADDDAVCGEVMPDCSTRVTGTLFDFASLAPIPDQEVRVVAALDALTNPTGADAQASGMSGGDGTFDFRSEGPISAPIATVAIVSGGRYYTTATGVQSDAGGYPPGTGIHEFWAVPQDSLNAWNASIDGTVDKSVFPVGEAGGIIGFVRDASGAPVAGATVAPDADGSGAQVLYPQADDSVVDTMTDETGLFMILGGASTGEDYVATSGGLSGSGTAGTGPNVVFALVITVE